MGDFSAQELANTAWALVTADQLDAQLFAALARATLQGMGDFIAQELASTVWAFATDGSQLVMLVGQTQQLQVHDFRAHVGGKGYSPTELFRSLRHCSRLSSCHLV